MGGNRFTARIHKGFDGLASFFGGACHGALQAIGVKRPRQQVVDGDALPCQLAARQTMSFDPPLSATVTPPWAWQESTAFTSGIPLLPPGRRLRVFFDALTPRFDSGLPMTYDVKLNYTGPPGTPKAFVDQYVLDLNIYKGGSPPEDGLPEIAKHLEQTLKLLKSWTYSIDGLRVYNVDAERHQEQLHERREEMRERGAARLAEARAAQSTEPEVPDDGIAEPDPHQI